MKNLRNFILVVVAIFTLSATNVMAQEEDSKLIDVGADVVSAYLWRGTAFSGPSIQPWLEVGLGNFAIGGWASYDFDASYAEADLYLSYGFDFGLSLGLTDYYFPESDYFEFSDTAGSHAFEINAGYEVGGFSLAGNYILNEAGGAGSVGGDLYFEVGYTVKNLGIFLGAGNGWHTNEEAAGEDDPSEDKFAVVNLGISASKDVKVTESFTLPIFGAVVLNPYTKAFHIYAGLSF